MKISLTIGHLYPDLMNIYGDRGNILALIHRAQRRGIDITVREISLNDSLRSGDIDIYFFGGGQDQAQLIIAEDLLKKADVLRAEITAGVPALTICGGYQLLGRAYVDQAGVEIPGLGIFPVITRAGTKRLVGNILIEGQGPFKGHSIIGFENHSGQTYLDDNVQPFGRVARGYGNNEHDKTEGVIVHHAIGTYLHGSLLPKNPIVTDWLLQQACQRKYPDFVLSTLDCHFEQLAFAETKNRLSH